MQRRDLVKYALSGGAFASLAGCKSAPPLPKSGGAVPDAHLTAPMTAPASGIINVAFLLAPKAEVVDFSGPWGVFEHVSVEKKDPFKLYTVAASKQAIRVSSDLNVVPNYSFDDAPAPNIVVVPAMQFDPLNAAILDWLRSAYKETDLMMSVCNGAFILGEAGLLDGKKATCHHGGYGSLRVYDVEVVRGARFVEDGKLATSGGLTSGTDLALRLVERYFGRDVAIHTAKALEYQGTGWMHPDSNAVWAMKPVSTAEHPICAVCEWEFDEKPKLKEEYRGRTYYFCGEWCRKHFLKTPQRFV